MHSPWPGINVNRFMDIACNGDDSLLEYSMLCVQLWSFYSKPGVTPEISACRDGACCNLTIFGVDTLDTDTIQNMIDSVPNFGEQCTDIRLYPVNRSIVFTLSPPDCKNGLANSCGFDVTSEEKTVLELTCELTPQQNRRINKVKEILEASDSRIDEVDFQIRTVDDHDILYISTFHAISARLMMALAQEHVAGIEQVKAIPVGDDRFQMEIVFEKCAQEPVPSLWSRLTGMLKRKKNRDARKPKQY